MRDGDDRHACPPRRQQAQDVGLVAVATKDVGTEPPQVPGDFRDHRAEVRRVVQQRVACEAERADPIEQGSRTPSIGKTEKLGPTAFGKALRHAQHLAFRTADKGGTGEVHDGQRGSQRRRDRRRNGDKCSQST